MSPSSLSARVRVVSFRAFTRRALGLGFGLVLAACSGAAPEAAAPKPKAPPTVAELMPLENDTVLSYETQSDAGDSGIMILNVRRPRPELAELDVAGRVQRLDVQSTSVSVKTGGYLLKAPIVVGNDFPGSFGRVRIVKVDAHVELPAGKFDECVVTVEESKSPQKRATSTYCPGVGLVSLVVEGDTGEDFGRVESRLKSYGKRVVLDG
jgi:hypothetical protein